MAQWRKLPLTEMVEALFDGAETPAHQDTDMARLAAGFYHIRGTTSRHWHGHILENNHRHVTNSDVGLSGVGPTAQLRFRAQSI